MSLKRAMSSWKEIQQKRGSRKAGHGCIFQDKLTLERPIIVENWEIDIII
jgi:hypothetical protein